MTNPEDVVEVTMCCHDQVWHVAARIQRELQEGPDVPCLRASCRVLGVKVGICDLAAAAGVGKDEHMLGLPEARASSSQLGVDVGVLPIDIVLTDKVGGGVEAADGERAGGRGRRDWYGIIG
jgi:hypothetical protein